MSEEDEEIFTSTSSEGDTNVLVCKTDEGKDEKVCLEMEKEREESSGQAIAEKGMLDNNTYNLMEQLLVENKSLWRIKNNYKNDARRDVESRQLWNFIEKDKEEIVKLLVEKLSERL